MKYLIYFLSLFLISSCAKKDASNHATSDLDSTTVWIQAASNKKLSKQERIKLLDKASNVIEEYPANRLKTSRTSQLALAYKKIHDTVSFKQKNAELLLLATKIKDYKSLGEAHWDLGSFLKHSQPDSAIYHYKEAYALFLEAELDAASKSYPGSMRYAIANVKDNNKDYVGAEKEVVKAIRYYQDHNINNRLYGAYNLLAVIQKGLGKYEKSLEYYEKAKEFIPFSKPTKKYEQELTSLNNLASINLVKEDYKKAISYYKEVLVFDSIQQKDIQSYANGLSGLAYAELKNGELNFEYLERKFLRSNQILDSLNNTYYKARNYEYYAQLLNKNGKPDQAIANALMAKAIAEKTSNNDRLLSSLKLLTTLDAKNSAQHAQAYFRLSEKLQAKERSIQDKFARIELETDEALAKNESLAKQRKTLIWISAGLLFLGLVIFIIINQRANNQRLRFQQSQQESNQEIYNLMLSQQGKFQEGKQLEQKRISEEIHDGILGQMLGIRLILTGLNERNDEPAVTQRAELIEKLRELEEEIRTISHELSSSAYKKVDNYIIAIKNLTNTIGLSSGIDIAFNFTESFNWDDLEGDIKINTYRIVQECLQNCVKHAKCNQIAVNLDFSEDKILLKVLDDGVGFNSKKGRKGIGLKNIISRINRIKGDLKIESAVGKGTEIIINVPLVKPIAKKEPFSVKKKDVLKA